MPLDVTLLADDGMPESEVPVSVTAHADLVAHVSRSVYRQLARLSDYDRDVSFSAAEATELHDELLQLLERVPADTELGRLVGALLGLTELAVQRRVRLAVIAD